MAEKTNKTSSRSTSNKEEAKKPIKEIIEEEGEEISELNGTNPDLDEMGEPDDESLLQQEEELENDELLSTKKSSILASELSEDPVRLYLREIGRVKLLSVESEFRLATKIEAQRLVTAYKRLPRQRKLSQCCGVYHELMSELLTSWKRLKDDARPVDARIEVFCVSVR